MSTCFESALGLQHRMGNVSTRVYVWWFDVELGVR
jgi:hypothetical protein